MTTTDAGRLDPDQRDLLSEQLVEQIGTLDAQIAEQRATVLESTGTARSQARRVLLRLMRWDDAYLARLDRIRSGGPCCRRCGRHLTFEQLSRQILAVHCERCPVTPSERHPSAARTRRPGGVTS